MAKLVRPKAMVDFFEVLNLYIMFYSSLGLGSTIMFAQFIEFVIFDTIKVRKQEWPVAFELMVVLMRKVENSANELNIGNVVREVYLNSAMKSVVEYEDEKRPTDDHSRTGLNAATTARSARERCVEPRIVICVIYGF